MEYPKPFEVVIFNRCDLNLFTIDMAVGVPSSLSYVNYDPALIIPFAFKSAPDCSSRFLKFYSVSINGTPM